MNRLRLAYNVLRYLGPRIVCLRWRVMLRNRLGITRRRFRTRPWARIGLADILDDAAPTRDAEYSDWKRKTAPDFLFPLGTPPTGLQVFSGQEAGRTPGFAERMALLEQDRCVYFFDQPSPEPIDWYRNPFDGGVSDPTRGWFEIPDYLPAQGDPRMMWEPARAAWAIDCAKAAAYGQPEAAFATFWRWFDSWSQACPPFLGFHWKCGQESAVRFVAIMFACWSMPWSEPTQDRLALICRFAWATGYRVFHHIHYAISQNNNHAFSEAVGLMLIAHLFPELREARRWRRLGRQVLLDESKRQIYSDGSYVQHSMNYERVMLQMGVLGARIAELDGEPLPREFYNRLERASLFLYQLMDADSGRLPAYGYNDGACVLPLSECDFHDFRPAIQSGHFLATREMLLPQGPWNEDLHWLFADEMNNAVDRRCIPQASSEFSAGGYYTLRGEQSWLMHRCHVYRDRPGHCDPLQIDLWWKGLNVVQDCGSYRYYLPDQPELEYYFKSIRAHNTVEIDGRNPLELVSRFLWFPWPRCFNRRWEPTEGVLESESRDYDRRPSRTLHRRCVVQIKHDLWIVVDDLLSEDNHTATIRWHLLDVPWKLDSSDGSLSLDTEAGPFGITVRSAATPTRMEVLRGKDEKQFVRGFASHYYGRRWPIPTLEAEFHSRFPLRILTALGPGQPVIPRRIAATESRESWEFVHGPMTHRLRLSTPRRSAIRILVDRESTESNVDTVTSLETGP